jgi:sigma-B regulation protein RsbU (phosphoserine phosphatase)
MSKLDQAFYNSSDDTAPLFPADEHLIKKKPRDETATAQLSRDTSRLDRRPRINTGVSILKSWQPLEPIDQRETARQLQEQQQIVLDTVKRLAESEARSELIIETAPDAFIGFDKDCRILNWNDQAVKMFGWSREETIGQRLWETIVTPEVANRQQTPKKVRDCREAISQRFELSVKHRDGHEFPVEITISGPIQADVGEFYGAFLRDISNRRQREEELRKAKEAAISQARSLEILNGISRELSALLNTDELLKRIGELLYQLLEYHSFSVLLLDPTGTKLIPRFSFSDSKVITKPALTIDRGLIGCAARMRQPVVVGDVQADPRYIKFHEETRSELSVPLIVKDKLIGVLDIENATPHYFRESHVQAMLILASQIAIALDNAMLYDRVTAHEQQLNEDLRFARKLQTQLLIEDLPRMKNAICSTLSWPARIIGGDIFKFGYYPKSQLHVGFVGDVTGKGAAAAIFAALSTGIIHQLMEQELFPAEMLKTLNEALMDRPLESHFVALVYTVWDDARRTLHIANSGLPRPIQYRDGKITVIDAVGTPLGLLPGLEFDELSLETCPGDVFLFPTDGILEAHNSAGEEFGYAGVENALSGCQYASADEIKNALARAIARHCDEVESQDDQTLIVFKVQGTGALTNLTSSLFGRH